ncbi:transmembrane protein 134 [Carcharodon carcharias]|uniref:transmembrane protein 134 n=1 Tax=Carcharodon carcharias TaxID=13397 RepID=UPI001B7F329D|nr:transmembrane protein 134 [Carcharodon carcharias]
MSPFTHQLPWAHQLLEGGEVVFCLTPLSVVFFQNLENEDALETNRSPASSTYKIRSDLGRCSTQSSRWSFSNISNSTQQSYRECLSWARHPLIQKNRRVVIACFILLIVGLVLVLVGVGLQVHPSSGVSSAIFFVPGFLLLIPGVYHVIYIYCALKGKTGYRFFYLPYFEK